MNIQTAHIFDRPIIILSAPRSGSTLLFELLSVSTTLWTIGSESHHILESLPELEPGPTNNYSNRLTNEDATPEVTEYLRAAFLKQLQTHDGQPYSLKSLTPLRFLEKTPKNALRAPFLDCVFPNAKYIFLYRDPRENISSIIDGWRSGNFVTYPQLSIFAGNWSFLLPEGWRAVSTRPLEEVAAFQWRAANEHILNHLAKLGNDRWFSLSYAELIASPDSIIARCCAFAEIPFDDALRSAVNKPLKPSRYTLTAPVPEKWRKNEKEVMRVLPGVQNLWERIKSTEDSAGNH